jgi:hypothetical protein
MNTVHSAILPQNTDPINDHDGASKRAFDVYTAYQHALADADVSFQCRSTRNAHLFTESRYLPHWQQFNLLRSLLRPPMVRPHILVLLSTPYNTPRPAGTMFELVRALNDGAETLKKRVPNPIGLTAGCELFIGFVTLFPHESAVSKCIISMKSPASWHHYRPKKSFSEIKREIVHQGKGYTSQAIHFRTKIAELALGFIKDDSVVRSASLTTRVY